ERHRRAVAEYRAQQPGTVPTITAAEVDALGAAIAPLLAAEGEAQAACDQARADYRDEVIRTLSGPLREFEAEFVAILERAEQMAAEGARLHKAAGAAGVKLPSTIPVI